MVFSLDAQAISTYSLAVVVVKKKFQAATYAPTVFLGIVTLVFEFATSEPFCISQISKNSSVL